MEDVLKTVSELKFRSIALIAAVILLALAVVWWLLGGSASPNRIRQPQRASASTSSAEPPAPPVVETRSEVLTEAAAAPEAPPELLIAGGRPSESPAITDRESAPVQAEQTAGQFTVQVGAFKLEAGALERQAELRSNGYESSLVVATGEDNVSYRLITGSFSTHNEASKMVEQLKLAGIDAFVRSNVAQEAVATSTGTP